MVRNSTKNKVTPPWAKKEGDMSDNYLKVMDEEFKHEFDADYKQRKNAERVVEKAKQKSK